MKNSWRREAFDLKCWVTSRRKRFGVNKPLTLCNFSSLSITCPLFCFALRKARSVDRPAELSWESKRSFRKRIGGQCFTDCGAVRIFTHLQRLNTALLCFALHLLSYCSDHVLYIVKMCYLDDIFKDIFCTVAVLCL